MFIILSLHVGPFLSQFVAYKQLMAKEGRVDSGVIEEEYDELCTLFAPCKGSAGDHLMVKPHLIGNHSSLREAAGEGQRTERTDVNEVSGG